jgi:hypothetical protein
MNQRLRLLLAAGIVPLATSCALTEQSVTLHPVGPSPVEEAQLTKTGFLQVYTAVKTYPVDAEMFYRVHTDYGVYAPGGVRVISVRNAATYHGLEPRVVSLPPGNYTVRGWADGFDLVRVPVQIKAGRLTVVNLQAGHNERFAGARSDELVRMSDGRIIGWSAQDGRVP